MKLADYLAKHQITQHTLAEHLGISQGRVSQWIVDGSVPAKYCPDIEVWSNREVTCEEMNDTVKWHYVRESAQSSSDISSGAKSDPQPTTAAQTAPRGDVEIGQPEGMAVLVFDYSKPSK